MIFAVFLGIGAVYLAFGNSKTDFNALGARQAYQTVVFSRFNGSPIHCSTLDDAQGCIDAGLMRGTGGKLLWMGASQVHTITNFRYGDVPAPALLFRRLRARGIDLVTFSQPNANAQEQYVLFEYLRQRLPLHALMLGAVYRNLKDDGLRPGVALALKSEDVRRELQSTEIGRLLLRTHEKGLLAGEESRRSLQDRSEEFLERWLGDHSKIWASREEARGWISVWLLELQDVVLFANWKARLAHQSNLAAPPIVPVPEVSRDHNLQAYEALLASAQRSGIKVMLYIAPRPSDTPFPFRLDLYEEYKSDLAKLADKYNASFVNLEDAVPSDSFSGVATVGGQAMRDIYHMNSEGQEVFARLLDESVSTVLHDLKQ